MPILIEERLDEVVTPFKLIKLLLLIDRDRMIGCRVGRGEDIVGK